MNPDMAVSVGRVQEAHHRPRVHRARRNLASFFLLTIAGTVGMVELAVRSHRMAGMLTVWDVERARAGREHFVDRGSFLEFEDRLLLEEIPQADYRRGGTFFFGTSSLKWSLKTWELPDAPSASCRNYGIGATNHRMQLQFLKFLVEHHRFLGEGAGKTRLVFGAAWSMGGDIPPGSYFGPLWERYGLYEYDDTRGIQPATPWRPLKAIRLERARCTSFLGGNLRRAGKALAGLLRPDSAGGRLTDPAVIAHRAHLLAGDPNWREPLERQLAAFGEFIDLVKARGGEVVVVLLPVRSTLRDMEMPAAYAVGVRAMCERYSVPFADLSMLLDDSEFWDMNHCDYAGLGKTHAALVDAAGIKMPNALADRRTESGRD